MYKLLRTWKELEEGVAAWTYGIQINDCKFEDLHTDKVRVQQLMQTIKECKVSAEEFRDRLEYYVDELYDARL